MNNKTYLVAHREYMENMRTKAFWIGILAFPVIISLSIFIPQWLDKQKDARTYTVVDHSEFGLFKKVKDKSAGNDLENILQKLIDDHNAEKDLSGYPEDAQNWAPGLAAFAKVMPLSDFMPILLGMMDMGSGALGAADSELIAKASEHDPEAKTLVRERIEALLSWYNGLTPEEAKKFSPGLNRGRFEHVEFDNLGPDPEKKLKKMVDRDELFAYIVIGENPVAGSDGCKYVSNNLTDNDLKNWFARTATSIVRDTRISNADIPSDIAKKIEEPLVFAEKKVAEGGETETVQKVDRFRQWAPVAFVYLLWISVFTSAQMLLTNTIEEKSNRIIEVLLSSISPIQLMRGKILGIAATGLTVVGSWAVFFLLAVKLLPVFSIPIPADIFGQIASDPLFLISFLSYYLFGFLFFAALLVSMGSVCSSLKEAQNLMQPVFLLLIVPLLAMIPVAQDPNGPLAKFLSYIPPFTPFVMMNRAAGPPTTTEYVLTTILLVVSIGIAFWGAAKVFRIGILMTGKPPKITEIIRWIRVPVGTVPETKD